MQAGRNFASPGVAFTGAACRFCLGCGSSPDGGAPESLLLKACSACKHAWYCGVDHQRGDYKDHKPFCAVLKQYEVFKQALLAEQGGVQPETARGAAHLKKCALEATGVLLEQKHGRDVSIEERMAATREATCSVCFRTRAQLATGEALVSCPTCRYGWACSGDHWQQYAPRHTPEVCARYCFMTACEELLYSHCKESGERPCWAPNNVRSEVRA